MYAYKAGVTGSNQRDRLRKPGTGPWSRTKGMEGGRIVESYCEGVQLYDMLLASVSSLEKKQFIVCLQWKI